MISAFPHCIVATRMDADPPSSQPLVVLSTRPAIRWRWGRIASAGAAVVVLVLLPPALRLAAIALGGLAVLSHWTFRHAGNLCRASMAHLSEVTSRWRAHLANAPIFLPPPVLRLGWAAAIGLFLISLVVGSIWPSASVGRWCFQLALGVGLAVGAFDLLSFGRTCLAWSLGRRIGIVVVGLSAAVSAAVALGLARKALFVVTGEDPGAFPASVALFTALLTPLAWLYVAAVVSLLMAWPLAIVGTVRLLFTRIDQDTSVSLDFLRCVRPVLLCVVPLFVVAQADTAGFLQRPRVQHLAQWAVVQLDFWTRPTCGGPAALANRLDDHRFSVAQAADPEHVRLQTVTCVQSATPPAVPTSARPREARP